MTSEGSREPHLAEVLTWDSDHFGIRVARVHGDRLDADRTRDVLTWAAANDVDCLYLLAAADAASTQRIAQAEGFRYVDARVTLSRPLAAPSAAVVDSIRPVMEADAGALRSLAHGAFTDSRFYADGNFDESAVERLYERWVDGSLDGSLADRVLVADDGGQASGYITLRFDAASGTGSIELVGTAAAARGRGVGRRLVTAALDEMARAGMSRASVVTQGRNVPAQRLYQSCGFRTDSVQIWFHRWSS